MQLASGCMWIWFADSIPALVGFLRALRFPPAPKNRYPFIFLVNSFWSLVVCIKPACLPEVWLPMCALRLSHSGALRTQWVDMSRVTKNCKLGGHCSNSVCWDEMAGRQSVWFPFVSLQQYYLPWFQLVQYFWLKQQMRRKCQL